MERGDWVQLQAYGGEIIRRRVVEVARDTVYVCRDEEYEKAERERREPVAIGFRLGDVVNDRAETSV